MQQLPHLHTHTHTHTHSLSLAQTNVCTHALTHREKHRSTGADGERASQPLHKGFSEAVGLGKAEQGWAKAETTTEGCWRAGVEAPESIKR